MLLELENFLVAIWRQTVWVINIQWVRWKFNSNNLSNRSSHCLLHSQYKCYFLLYGGSYQLIPAQLQLLTVGKTLSLLLQVLFEAYRAALALTVIIEITFLRVTYLILTHLIFLSAVIFFLVALSGNSKKAIVNEYRAQDSLKAVWTLYRWCAGKNTQNEYWFAMCVGSGRMMHFRWSLPLII